MPIEKILMRGRSEWKTTNNTNTNFVVYIHNRRFPCCWRFLCLTHSGCRIFMLSFFFLLRRILALSRCVNRLIWFRFVWMTLKWKQQQQHQNKNKKWDTQKYMSNLCNVSCIQFSFWICATLSFVSLKSENSHYDWGSLDSFIIFHSVFYSIAIMIFKNNQKWNYVQKMSAFGFVLPFFRLNWNQFNFILYLFFFFLSRFFRTVCHHKAISEHCFVCTSVNNVR